VVVEGEQQVLGELREDTGGGELDAGGDGVDSAQRIAAFVVLDGFSIAVTTGHASLRSSRRGPRPVPFPKSSYGRSMINRIARRHRI
jgi:hypothetical protein